jgi:large subunit ribosomal protein L30
MKVKLVKSPIGCTPAQRKNLQAMGLRRLHQVREVPDNGPSRGRLNKVKHLVEVVSA